MHGIKFDVLNTHRTFLEAVLRPGAVLGSVKVLLTNLVTFCGFVRNNFELLNFTVFNWTYLTNVCLIRLICLFYVDSTVRVVCEWSHHGII